MCFSDKNIEKSKLNKMELCIKEEEIDNIIVKEEEIDDIIVKEEIDMEEIEKIDSNVTEGINTIFLKEPLLNQENVSNF